jgi:lysophospholipase L1-like esterase
MPDAATSESLYVLTGIDVMTTAPTGAVVAFGDSITDGYGSTLDADRRWPNDLARRFNASECSAGMAVLDQGISGNRLLHDVEGPNSLARFDRDVLALPGITHVVLLEGINDIGLPGYTGNLDEQVSSQEIIGAYRQLIVRAHDKGLKILVATLTPFEGSGEPYYSREGERKREEVNAWIRAHLEFDGVIDFDRAIQDPTHPTRILAEYDSGDHLHPNDAGYEAMVDAIDLRLFRVNGAPPSCARGRVKTASNP